MKLGYAIFLIALFGGIASGPGALESAAASQPPVRWADLSFDLFGSFLAGLLVPGFQVLRSDPKYGRLAIQFFAFISIWVLASGASALAIAAMRGDLLAHTLLFLVAGIGLSGGVAGSLALHRWRFKDDL